MSVNRQSYFANEAPVAQAPRSNRAPFGNLATATEAPRPRSKLWLNVGRTINGEFISPLGIALDSLEPQEIRSQSVEFVKKKTAENQLLVALKTLGFSFEPGQVEPIMLEVQLRRVNEELVVQTVENEFAIEPSSLLMRQAAE
jgi:hypothetical protein